MTTIAASHLEHLTEDQFKGVKALAASRKPANVQLAFSEATRVRSSDYEAVYQIEKLTRFLAFAKQGTDVAISLRESPTNPSSQLVMRAALQSLPFSLDYMVGSLFRIFVCYKPNPKPAHISSIILPLADNTGIILGVEGFASDYLKMLPPPEKLRRAPNPTIVYTSILKFPDMILGNASAAAILGMTEERFVENTIRRHPELCKPTTLGALEKYAYFRSRFSPQNNSVRKHLLEETLERLKQYELTHGMTRDSEAASPPLQPASLPG